MKRIILAAFAAATLLGSTAQAATYSLTTTTAQEAAITDARTRFNNSLPLGASDPGAFAANGGFMLNVLTNAIQSWNAAHAVPVTMDVPTKNSVITMLQAAVARADANSAAAQTVLTALQNAQ